jgi:hypothetical protein
MKEKKELYVLAPAIPQAGLRHRLSFGMRSFSLG